MAKKAKLAWTKDKVDLMIRAAEHLADAYKASKTPGDKATVTKLLAIRDELKQESGQFSKQ